jgi:hypothetical protein
VFNNILSAAFDWLSPVLIHAYRCKLEIDLSCNGRVDDTTFDYFVCTLVIGSVLLTLVVQTGKTSR